MFSTSRLLIKNEQQQRVTDVLQRMATGWVDVHVWDKVRRFPIALRLVSYFIFAAFIAMGLLICILGNYYLRDLGKKGNQYLPGYSVDAFKQLFDAIGADSSWIINIAASMYTAHITFSRARRDFLFYNLSRKLGHDIPLKKIAWRYSIAIVSSIFSGIALYLISELAEEGNNSKKPATFLDKISEASAAITSGVQCFYGGYSLAEFFETIKSYLCCGNRRIIRQEMALSDQLQQGKLKLLQYYRTTTDVVPAYLLVDKLNELGSDDLELPLIAHRINQPKRSTCSTVARGILHLSMQFTNECGLVSEYILFANALAAFFHIDPKSQSPGELTLIHSVCALLFLPIVFMYAQFTYQMANELMHSEEELKPSWASRLAVDLPTWLLKFAILIVAYISNNSTLEYNAESGLTADWFTYVCCAGLLSSYFSLSQLLDEGAAYCRSRFFFSAPQRKSLDELDATIEHFRFGGV